MNSKKTQSYLLSLYTILSDLNGTDNVISSITVVTKPGQQENAHSVQTSLKTTNGLWSKANFSLINVFKTNVKAIEDIIITRSGDIVEMSWLNLEKGYGH